jgi:subtilisin family serine protease
VCIAAAEPTGGLCWPAALPHVLAVGAIGQLGTFPPEDTDTAALTSQLTPEGFFAPGFGSAGPAAAAVDCCAPGVAIISGLPPSSYGPLSGPGTAAAHVTALAALILAHHPSFRQELGRPTMTRDSTRPAMLLGIIKGSCRPLPQLDPARTGAGIPDAAVALSVAPWGTHPPLAMPYPAPRPAQDGRMPLEPLQTAMMAAGLIAGGDRPSGQQTS